MSTEPNRSEQVIADFKRRKLARSAMCRIQELIRSFEEEHAFDRKAALIGVIVLAVMVVVSVVVLFSRNSITPG